MTASNAAERIREMTGIHRSEQRIRAFMKRHHLKFIKCGHTPSIADNDTQHKWVETELKPVIEAAQKEELHLFFCDAAHFVLQPFLCSLWCAFRVFIKASAGRNRINVLGAVNACTQEVITLINTTYITSATLIEFLKLLKEKFSDKPIAIILDNAKYQHCFVVTTFAKSIGIHLLFLPPYSPNLNIIERVWKFTKKKILYAKYYEKPKLFHQAVQKFFAEINLNFKTELSSLLTLKFQFFDDKNSLIYPLCSIAVLSNYKDDCTFLSDTQYKIDSCIFCCTFKNQAAEHVIPGLTRNLIIKNIEIPAFAGMTCSVTT